MLYRNPTLSFSLGCLLFLQWPKSMSVARTHPSQSCGFSGQAQKHRKGIIPVKFSQYFRLLQTKWEWRWGGIEDGIVVPKDKPAQQHLNQRVPWHSQPLWVPKWQTRSKVQPRSTGRNKRRQGQSQAAKKVPSPSKRQGQRQTWNQEPHHRSSGLNGLLAHRGGWRLQLRIIGVVKT